MPPARSASGDALASRRVARELGLRDQAECAPMRQEVAMAAALHDPAMVDHADLVGLSDRRQAMGDDDGRPPFTQGSQRFLDRLPGLRSRAEVASSSRMIGASLRNAPSDALALPAGELHAVLAAGRVIIVAIGMQLGVGVLRRRK